MTSIMGGTMYNRCFYERHMAGMEGSAADMLGLLYGVYSPQSVVDIGCGRGAWLVAADRLGSTKLVGVDGPWIHPSDLLIRKEDFRSMDLSKELPSFSMRFDLCISLEVAEHIESNRSEQFVDVLCAASDCVLFGAAVKHQGGTGHINEHRQSYWIELFDDRGYECCDFFRPKIWNNDDIESWYRQNTFLFIDRNSELLYKFKLQEDSRNLSDAIHPTLFESRCESFEELLARPTLRLCTLLMARWIKNRFGRRSDRSDGQ